MDGLELRERDGALVFDVLVAPRASRSAIVGVHDGRLKVALEAPPVDGKANAALVQALAAALDVPRRSVEIVQGLTAKRKAVAIRGLSAEALRERLVGLHSSGG